MSSLVPDLTLSHRYGSAEGGAEASDPDGGATGAVLWHDAESTTTTGASTLSSACASTRKWPGQEAGHHCRGEDAVGKPKGGALAVCVAQDAHPDNENVLRRLLQHGERGQRHREVCQVCCGRRAIRYAVSPCSHCGMSCVEPGTSSGTGLWRRAAEARLRGRPRAT